MTNSIRNSVLPEMPSRPLLLASTILGALAAIIGNALEERRLFVLLPFATICGILAYCLVRSEPQLWALGLAGLALIALLILMRKNLSALRLIALLTALWTGFSLLPIHGALFGTPMLSAPVYGTYTGKITGIISAGGDVQRVVASSLQPVDDSRAIDIRRVRLFVRNGPELSLGDTINSRMRLAAVPGPVTPGSFDSQFHAYFDGIGAFGTVLGDLTIIQHAGHIDPLRAVSNLRREIGRRIDLALELPEAGIARALTIGDQSRISEETRTTMATAGLAHVLAISGLHLTLVAGGVFLTMRRGLGLSHTLALRLPLKKIGAITGIVAALIYLVLSGASVSAIRATIMLILVFGAVLAERQALTMRNVAFAALALIAIDPSSVFRPGFQLSFAAVAGLVGVYEATREFNEHRTGILAAITRFFAGLAVTSLIAGLATVLFAAYHFQQTAPLGILGNMLALPLVGFVVLPSAFLSILVMPLGLEQPFLWLMGWAISLILDIARFVAGASENLSHSPLLTPVALIVGFAALGWFAFFTGRTRYAGPLAAIPLIIFFGLGRSPDILIADTTQAVAIRGADGLGLIAGRTGSFAVDAWSETYMEPVASSLPGAACDNSGCFVSVPDMYAVALVEGDGAFAEDCRAADLVITRLVAPSDCSKVTQVIDAANLATGGTHWAAWNPEALRFTIQPAITDPGRPWRPR